MPESLKKTCSKCKTEKPLDGFSKNRAQKDGLQNYCKTCHSLATGSYYKRHRDQATISSRVWRNTHKKRSAAITSKWGKANRKTINSRRKSRRDTDLNYKIECYVRTRLWVAVQGGLKAGSSIKDCGCPTDTLRERIESLFWPGMTWDNWGPDGWHIDHDIPLSAFDLGNREQFLSANHYTNLSPLWHDDNLSKSDRLDWTPQESIHELPARFKYN